MKNKQEKIMIDGFEDSNASKAVLQIRSNAKTYFKENNIKALVLGVSGGIDSALVATLMSPVAQELNIPMIGAFIQIESNSEDERKRAEGLRDLFSKFLTIDLTDEYLTLRKSPMWKNIVDFKDSEKKSKIRNGNIKARMRMMYLYNLAQMNSGLVLSTDNRTEYMVGFWTLNGDVGDFGPIQELWKTEVYHIADHLQFNMDESDTKQALIATIDADATDGLGITNSDLDQLTDKEFTSSQEGYRYVDDVLIAFLNQPLNMIDGKIISRHLRTSYKRNWPIVISRNSIFKE